MKTPNTPTERSSGSRKRLAPLMVLAVLALPSGCVTALSECPIPLEAYDEKTRLQAAGELESLPPGGLSVLIEDYNTLRAACRGTA